jgi:hypothetical protein
MTSGETTPCDYATAYPIAVMSSFSRLVDFHVVFGPPAVERRDINSGLIQFRHADCLSRLSAEGKWGHCAMHSVSSDDDIRAERPEGEAVRQDHVKGVVMFALLAPVVFVWAYIRPANPDLLQWVLVAIAAVTLTLAAYFVAGWIVRRVTSRREL